MKKLSLGILSLLVMAGGCRSDNTAEGNGPAATPPGQPGGGRPPGSPSTPPSPEGNNPGMATPPATTPPPAPTPTPGPQPSPVPPVDNPTPPAPTGMTAGEVPATGPALGKGNPMSTTGLDRHDALYCGEWQKTTKPGDTIYLVRGGKVTWSYSLNSSGGNEFGDCTLTTYGTVTYPLKNSGAFEIKVDEAKGKATNDDVVWQWKQDGGSEVHSVQPIGKDRALVMQNGNPPKLLLIDKTKAKVCSSANPGGCILREWHPPGGGGTHGMFRHVRMLANGNLLIPNTGTGSHLVVEYKPMPAPSTELVEVWKYDTGAGPWAAVRLGNGNTLISGNSQGWFREVTHDNPPKVVWEATKKDFPYPMYFAQGAQRLSNGNTLVASWCGSDVKDAGKWGDTWQYYELTHDMPPKVLWSLKQWDNPNLGPGSSMQALDEPGVPENPGELAR